MRVNKTEKLELVKQFGKSNKDTGSVEVQVAILTKEINNLTEHLVKNKKDYISKRGLFIKVSKRKSLLKYLESKDIERSRALVQKINDLQ